jgi:hypothetical protein
VSCKAHGEKLNRNNFAYIAVEEKAVINDKESHMTKLAEAVPNELEDTRLMFVGNHSPARVGYLQAKKNNNGDMCTRENCWWRSFGLSASSRPGESI